MLYINFGLMYDLNNKSSTTHKYLADNTRNELVSWFASLLYLDNGFYDYFVLIHCYL